jgi:hypothetical protein
LLLQLEDFPLVPQSLRLKWAIEEERTLLPKNLDAPMYDETPCMEIT